MTSEKCCEGLIVAAKDWGRLINLKTLCREGFDRSMASAALVLPQPAWRCSQTDSRLSGPYECCDPDHSGHYELPLSIRSSARPDRFPARWSRSA
jgi:hypothetical protein